MISEKHEYERARRTCRRQQPSKLVANRIDDELIARYLIEQDKEKTPITTLCTLQTLEIYLACNPKTDPGILTKLRKTAKQVK